MHLFVLIRLQALIRHTFCDFHLCRVMSLLNRRYFPKLLFSTVVVALLIFFGIYIHDLLRSFNVEYIPVVQLPDDVLNSDVLEMSTNDILFYNRVPKTGSSSMMSMLKKLQVSY